METSSTLCASGDRKGLALLSHHIPPLEFLSFYKRHGNDKGEAIGGVRRRPALNLPAEFRIRGARRVIL